MQAYSRTTTKDDAVYLSQRLRVADRAEYTQMTGVAPEVGLPKDVTKSDLAVTLVGQDGTPFGIYGVSTWFPDKPHIGAIWLLATDDLERNALAFLRGCRPHLDEMHKRWSVLINYSDARNLLHHKWLEWCGFTFFGAPILVGADKLPFLPFARINH